VGEILILQVGFVGLS